MSEEKIIATAPVTEGTITINIAEYRGLIEAVEQYKAAAAVSAAEQNKSWWDAHNAKDALVKSEKHIEELREQIAELKEAGRKVCEFLDSKPHLRGEYNLFRHERDLERAAEAVESGADDESHTD